VPATDSFKYTIFSRGVFTAGTQGVGFIALSPTVCNIPSIFTTSSNYVRQDISPLSGNDLLRTGVSITTSPINVTPEVVARDDATGSARIVCTSMRVRYCGTELNRGGRLVSWTPKMKDDYNAYETYTFDELASFPTARVSTVSRDWHQLSIVPVTYDDYTYPSNVNFTNSRKAYPLSANLRNIGGFTYGDYTYTPSIEIGSPMGYIMCDSVVPGMAFEYEIITHAEAIGPAFARLTTPNAVDPEGTETVLAAAQRHLGSDKSSTRQNMWSLMMTELRTYAQKNIKHVIPIALNAAVAML
jgi:hypothetical protein